MRLRSSFFAIWFGLLLGIAYAGPVTDEKRAQELFANARQQVAALGLSIPREILLKLRTADELNVELHTHGGRSIEANGFYQPYNPETIWIVSGLSENDTVATMAHELTHAWQSTDAPQQDRKLVEGFARWVEYHVLVAIGDEAHAIRLQIDPDPDYGGGLRYLLELEKSKGAAAVVEFARTKTRIE